jgi:hypothetical protein
MVIYQGETRNLGITITNSVNSTFTIESADFAVSNSENVVINSGTATIDGHNVYALFNGTTVGEYTLVFIYKVGVEIMKAKLNVEVTE